MKQNHHTFRKHVHGACTLHTHTHTHTHPHHALINSLQVIQFKVSVCECSPLEGIVEGWEGMGEGGWLVLIKWRIHHQNILQTSNQCISMQYLMITSLFNTHVQGTIKSQKLVGVVSSTRPCCEVLHQCL